MGIPIVTNHVAGSQGRVLRTASNKVVVLDAILYIFGQEYRPHLNKRPRFDIIFYGSNGTYNDQWHC